MEIQSKHLIHIGFPKAGSTFLQEWFEKHPDFKYKNGGIAGFSNLYDMVSESGNPEWEHVKYLVTSFEGIVTPQRGAGKIWNKENDYMDGGLINLKKNQQTMSAVLKHLIPEAKILIVTRAYRSFIISAYSQLLKTGGILDFNAVKAAAASSEYDFLNYNDVIKLYSNLYGEENVIVLPYELLRDDKEAFVRELEEKLEVSHHTFIPGVVNPSLSNNQMFWYLKFSRLVSRFLKLGGNRFHAKYYEKYAVKLFFGKFDFIIGMASRIFPEKVLRPDISDNTFRDVFTGERLRENPLFDEYHKDYFLQ